jgi:hypothetical protein
MGGTSTAQSVPNRVVWYESASSVPSLLRQMNRRHKMLSDGQRHSNRPSKRTGTGFREKWHFTGCRPRCFCRRDATPWICIRPANYLALGFGIVPVHTYLIVSNNDARSSAANE